MELGNLSSMLRERLKRRPRKSLSTDAGHRDGATRMSDEGSVMELEQRGCIIRPYCWVNLKEDELDE